ncbi:MAG: VWA domain-containing protein [Coriobacteriia bacterium]|nr:VWA domain-containing protein [Coriobacteriia bacterium]
MSAYEDAIYETTPLEQIQRDRMPEAINEAHLALVLLLDVSGSMAGDPLDNLNRALVRFKKDLASDAQAQRSVDVAVVTFGSDVDVVQDFVPLPHFQPPTLQASGLTAMGAGINRAIDLVEQRTELYRSLGTPSHRPWIMMMTDGCPTDDIADAERRIAEEEGRGLHTHLKFFALGTPGHDEATLRRLTKVEKRYMQLSNTDFTGIFHWLSESMSVMSSSMPGANPQLPALPANATLPPSSW